MKILYLIITAVALVFFISCSSVRSKTLEGADLNGYRSFTIMDHGNDYLPQLNPVHKSQIESAITQELKILSPDNLGVTGADILVNYFVLVNTRKDFETYTNYYKKRWRNQIVEVEVRDYKEGTLIIDFFDAKTNQIVWNGSITSIINTDSIALEKKINQAVKSLFQQFKKDRTSVI